jgi:hypothetical protein
VGLHAALAVLSDRDEEAAEESRELAEAALRAAPAADAWAIRFIQDVGAGRPGMTTRQCRDIVTGAVDGIAHACVGDGDDRLVALLTAAVSDTARFVGASPKIGDVRAEAESPDTPSAGARALRRDEDVAASGAGRALP